MTTLCDLAARLPVLVAGLLDREDQLKRGRFREETLTDIFTGALAAFAGPDLVIEYPPEAATGGDLDIDFWHVGTGRWFGLRIQAKRLNAATNRGKSVKAKVRSYKELLHEAGVPGTNPRKTEYQFRTLLASCGSSRLPLYMFYNHGAIVSDPHFVSKSPSVRGINLAFASDIARQMEHKVRGRKNSRNNKRLDKLQPYFFALEALFCTPLVEGEIVPSPDSVARSLGNVWSEVAENASDKERTLRVFLRPPFVETSGAPVRRVADGFAVRVNDDLQRPKLTFISGKTDDERTPVISLGS